MGTHDPDDPNDPFNQPPDYDGPRRAIEGEIVVYRPYPGSGYSSNDGRTGPRTHGPDVGYGHRAEDYDDEGQPRDPRGRTFGPRSYDEGLVEEVIAYRVTHPHEGARTVGARFGISRSTVERWTRDDIDRRSSIVDTARKRAEAAIQLEAAQAEAWKLYDAATGRSPKDARMLRTALEALRTVDMIAGSHAKLLGLNMPVKVDVQVTELTEAERELQEMINEAAARAATLEADVIAQASEDPDL